MVDCLLSPVLFLLVLRLRGTSSVSSAVSLGELMQMSLSMMESIPYTG